MSNTFLPLTERPYQGQTLVLDTVEPTAAGDGQYRYIVHRCNRFGTPVEVFSERAPSNDQGHYVMYGIALGLGAITHQWPIRVADDTGGTTELERFVYHLLIAVPYGTIETALERAIDGDVDAGRLQYPLAAQIAQLLTRNDGGLTDG